MSEQDQNKSKVAQTEEGTQAFWEANDIFNKSVNKPAPKGDYVFYDGPPFATGLPHYGHIVASVIKDVVPRYWTMQGYRVPRVWGWDCHGLPIENIVEKELGFKHKKDIKEYGIAKFNEMCRQQVMTYAAEWEKIIPRIGRWADMEHSYRTMDKPFMESVWWVFKSIYDKGLVYEDYRSMHICPRCETTLSQQEVSEGYKDVKDISVTVKFKLKNPEKLGLKGDVYMLAWTTTPWTLPGNVALAVNNDITYSVVSALEKELEGSEKKPVSKVNINSIAGAQFIVASSLVEKNFENHDIQPEVIKEVTGKELVGLEYEPLFDYCSNDQHLKNHENGWKVYAADFVTADSGTGIAHEAPAFGAEDWELAKQVNLPFVQHVNFDGTMKAEVVAFAGAEVKPRSDDDKVRLGTDIAVLKYLQDHNLFFSKENLTHSYPHCWRCDTPLLNYATSSWFVNITKIKDNLLDNAKNVSWSPEHIKEGRFGKWLEGARDWSISRQRFWASVIPLWVCEKCKTKRVFGSASELEEASGKKIDDLHKHIVDEVTVPCSCGGVMHRIPDVLDTWFDSGSMPYGERHYPFEGKEQFDAVFPAQFIAEGLDQTRAWFYYLHVLAGALFEKNAFQNVIVNGIVLAEDGKKMSKKLKNYPDPMEVVNKYGADALRLYLMSSPVVQAENLAFSEKGVDEWLKKVIMRLENVHSFYELYKGELAHDAVSTSENVLDVWILARLSQVHAEVSDAMGKYQLDSATRPFMDFVDDLSTWYLRRSRDRFKGDDIADKSAALSTMLSVLKEFSKMLAPFAPFVAERVWQSLKSGNDVESVHLAEWPNLAHLTSAKVEAEGDMQMVRDIVTLALEQRSKAGIPARQPLSKIIVHSKRELGRDHWFLVHDEVNIKEIDFLVSEVPHMTVVLETEITPELRAEGLVREFTRAVQDARKKGDYSPSDKPALTIDAEGDLRTILEAAQAQILKAANVREVTFGPVSDATILEIGESKVGIVLLQ